MGSPLIGPLSRSSPPLRAACSAQSKVVPFTGVRRAVPNAALRVECVRDASEMERLAPEWDALESQISPRLPFRGAWWNILWWRHFREDRFLVSDALRVYVVRDETRALIAVFPMMVTRRPGRGWSLHRKIQFLGADPNLTEVRGPICRVRDQARAVDAVAKALHDGQEEWDEVQWSGLQPDAETGSVLASVPGVRWGEPIEMFCLDLPPSWEEFKASRSRNIKESIRKCYNSLRRAGHECRLRVDGQAGEGAIDEFLELHRLRASCRDMVPHADVFASPDSRAFLRAYAAHLAHRGSLRVFRLEIAGQTVAARLGIQLGDELYLSFSGFRPEWAPFSVATTLVAEVLQWAIANGVRRVNLSVGRDVSKTRWGPSVTTFERADQVALDPRSAWRRRMYEAARACSRDGDSWAGQWLKGLRRNQFGRA